MESISNANLTCICVENSFEFSIEKICKHEWPIAVIGDAVESH